VRRTLLEAYARLKARRGVHEVGLVDFENRFDVEGFRSEASSTHVIPLAGDFSATWEESFDKSKRRQTRKALKEGLGVREARGPAEMSRYYAIYARRVADWKERFRYPERLFEALFAAGGGGVKLFIARRGDELLGGHLNFYYRESVIAWNGVVRDTADGTQASTLLYAECIRHACEQGYRSYNLGGSLGKQSLVDYKESLGGVAYHYRTLRWQSPVARLVAAAKTIVSMR
jgi:lipid II:glycine glycyltransferase (peptidoglycan interpeptide bridge formation enzyme)